ncbi:MAG: hypothetical protein DCF16_18130 [Alphaproteobacteria bacterium]|nr:MAG: hypothetical protein DCF16_18130 [Alphaproteobacteria bacterium]
MARVYCAGTDVAVQTFYDARFLQFDACRAVIHIAGKACLGKPAGRPPFRRGALFVKPSQKIGTAP